MTTLIRMIAGLLVDLFRSRAALEAEILVLRQQIIVLRRGMPTRLPFMATDRLVLGVGLSTVSERPRRTLICAAMRVFAPQRFSLLCAQSARAETKEARHVPLCHGWTINQAVRLGRVPSLSYIL